MNRVLLIALAIVVFFAVFGMQRASGVYRRVLRELNLPPLYIHRDQWFGLTVAIPLLSVIPGMLLLFVPGFVERHMLVGVIVALQSEGAISEDQAKDYLRAKGVKGI